MEDFSQGLEVSEHLVASLGGVPLSLPITGGILPYKASKGNSLRTSGCIGLRVRLGVRC